MKKINLGKTSIELDAYASQGNAILGIRGSGKTYSGTSIAEQLLEAGVPIVGLDPIGMWRFLRVPAKPGGKAYQVVVAGGQHGDIPLPVRGAGEIMRAALADQVSIVFDLYDVNLSKADWRSIVNDVVKVLLYENKEHGLRHIFIEEAAEFVPQRISPDQNQVYSIIERLVRMGGNAQLGVTLINQRAEEVNKAVLELCDLLLLHRQKGRRSLENLSHWLELAAGTTAKAIAADVPTLKNGECYVWPEGAEAPTKTVIPAKHTFHPDRKDMRTAVVAEARRVDIGAFAEQLKGRLAQVIAEAEANDPAVLKKRIRELEHLRAGNADAAPDPRALAAALNRGYAQGRESILDAISDVYGPIKTAGMAIAAADKALAELHRAPVVPQVYAKRHTPAAEPLIVDAEWPEVKPRVNGAASGLPPKQQEILNALGELEQLGSKDPQRVMVAFLSGYTNLNSKGLVNSLGALRSAGLIDYPDPGRVVLTAEGRKKAHPPPRPRSSQDLQARLIQLLGGASARILEPLIAAYPKPMAREDVAKSAGYGNLNSKGFVNAIGRLRSLGFIDYQQRGQVVAQPILFLE